MSSSRIFTQIVDNQLKQILTSALVELWDMAVGIYSKNASFYSPGEFNKGMFNNTVILLKEYMNDSGDTNRLKIKDVDRLSQLSDVQLNVLDQIAFISAQSSDIMGVRECAERYLRFSRRIAYVSEHLLRFDRATAVVNAYALAEHAGAEVLNDISTIIKAEFRELLKEIIALTQRLSISADKALELHLTSSLLPRSQLIQSHLLSPYMKEKIDCLNGQANIDVTEIIFSDVARAETQLGLIDHKSREICHAAYTLDKAHGKARVHIKLELILKDENQPGLYGIEEQFETFNKMTGESCYYDDNNDYLRQLLQPNPLVRIGTFLKQSFFGKTVAQVEEDPNTVELLPMRAQPHAMNARGYLKSLTEFMIAVNNSGLGERITEYLLMTAALTVAHTLGAHESLAADTTLCLGR